MTDTATRHARLLKMIETNRDYQRAYMRAGTFDRTHRTSQRSAKLMRMLLKNIGVDSE
jgi:hypothetical protein